MVRFLIGLLPIFEFKVKLVGFIRHVHCSEVVVERVLTSCWYLDVLLSNHGMVCLRKASLQYYCLAVKAPQMLILVLYRLLLISVKDKVYFMLDHHGDLVM